MDLYEKAKQAIMEVFTEDGVDADERINNLQSLIDEIEIFIETLYKEVGQS